MIIFLTQRAQRAQRFYPHSYLRWRWRSRKLRYDERAQRVYPPLPLLTIDICLPPSHKA